MSLYLGTNCISAGGSSAFRNTNIGEIIQSTIPLTDAGLHLLDGSVISGSGSYSAFVTHIAGLVSSYPELFATESDWQTSVTNYGVCGKFVYDSVNNTVRLPKIKGFTEGTIDPTVLGDLAEAGLPNITGSTYLKEAHGKYIGLINNNGCILGEDSGVLENANGGGDVGGNGLRKFVIDASRSSSIYGNSSTVQPQSIKVLYYIVIATSTKTEIEVDIDEVMTDLNGKVSTADLATCHVVVETYVNGSDWYRVYDDGWCEQGGHFGTLSASLQTVYFLKEFTNTNYNIQVSFATTVAPYTSSASVNYYEASNKTASSFTIYGHGNANIADKDWRACGYIR